MTDMSLIEFGVYAFLCYSSMLMLIISTIKKDVPVDNPLTIIRVVFFIPGIICAGVLSGSGINITTETINTSNTIKDLNNTDTWSETTTQLNKFVLINPVWITVNFMVFIVLLVYVVQQVLILFDTLKKKANR